MNTVVEHFTICLFNIIDFEIAAGSSGTIKAMCFSNIISISKEFPRKKQRY